MGKLRKGELIEVGIDDLAYGGHGVARLHGLVVMVSGGVPGDRVRARGTRMRRSLAEAKGEELSAQSLREADRVDGIQDETGPTRQVDGEAGPHAGGEARVGFSGKLHGSDPADLTAEPWRASMTAPCGYTEES